MLAEFNVTQIAGLPNLNETELFIDPLEAQYRAVGPLNPTDFAAGTGNFSQASIQAKVEFFTAKKAYQNVDAVEAALDAFWASKTAKEKRDGKYEHYNMPAQERRDRLNGFVSDLKHSSPLDKRVPSIKGRSPMGQPKLNSRQPGPYGLAHLNML
jgi:hypothetical protein